MTAAYVAGVQSQAVACCVKHLVCNDQGSAPHTVSSKVGDAALRELYLAPFEAAVRVGAWSIMAAYNKLNGEYVTEHPWLLTTLLRDEWHGRRRRLRLVRHPVHRKGTHGRRGPGDAWPVPATRRQAAQGPRKSRRAGHRGHRPFSPQGAPLTAPHSTGRKDSTAIRSVRADPRSRRRGIVLLKNDGVLPLAVTPGTVVAVIGSGADAGQPQGGGSCQVNPPHVADPLSAIKARLAPDATVRFARGWADQTARARLPHQTSRSVPPPRPPDSEVLATEHAVSLSLSWLTPVLPGYESGEPRSGLGPVSSPLRPAPTS